MNEVRFTLTENARLAPNVYRLRLAGDASAITAPGQFLELSIPGFFLRRPLSVCDWEDGSVTILYRAVGDGTRALAEMKPGQTIDALCGLGNGFDVTACGEKTLVIGGACRRCIALQRDSLRLGKHRLQFLDLIRRARFSTKKNLKRLELRRFLQPPMEAWVAKAL